MNEQRNHTDEMAEQILKGYTELLKAKSNAKTDKDKEIYTQITDLMKNLL